MTTAKRRRGHSLHLELPDGPSDSPPTVAAIFLILFDPKAGYAPTESVLDGWRLTKTLKIYSCLEAIYTRLYVPSNSSLYEFFIASFLTKSPLIFQWNSPNPSNSNHSRVASTTSSRTLYTSSTMTNTPASQRSGTAPPQAKTAMRSCLLWAL